MRRVLAGEPLVAAGELFEITWSRPHGHVAAVAAMARKLGFPGLLGPACRERDLAYALIVAGACRPGSKAGHGALVGRYHPGTRLGHRGGGHRRGVRRDGLAARTAADDRAGARRPPSDPGRGGALRPVQLVAGGRTWPLAAFGHSRDGRRGKPQICYGLVTDADGRPVAVNVFPGNTADPTVYTSRPP